MVCPQGPIHSICCFYKLINDGSASPPMRGRHLIFNKKCAIKSECSWHPQNGIARKHIWLRCITFHTLSIRLYCAFLSCSYIIITDSIHMNPNCSYSSGCKTGTNGRVITSVHGDVIKWKHFPRYWLFVRGTLPRSLVVPLTKASDAELWCFMWSAPEQTVEQTT